jgi:hypothetical protein
MTLLARTTRRGDPRRTSLVARVTTCAVVLSALVLAACGSSKTAPATGSAAPPSGEAATGEAAKTCTTSEDCALVSACCGCTAGGRQIAIRKDAVAAFDASREQRCGGQMCTQVMSTDPSCTAEAICGAQGTCEVAPHLQHD